MLKLEDIQDQSTGFVKDGTIICKARILLIGKSARYMEMMERRRRKQNENGSQSLRKEVTNQIYVSSTFDKGIQIF